MEFETGHSDHVNDLQLDYYGKRLASASSDATVRVFELSEPPTLLTELRGHAGPVWQVTWAHPKYGSTLASCSFDNTAIVWRETDAGWSQVYQSPRSVHQASVNGVDWASHEVGMLLATASSDGSVGIFQCQSDGSWEENKVSGVDAVSCTSISWAPVGLATSLSDDAGESHVGKRFVVGGCENCLKILSMTSAGWKIEKKLTGHTDWVLDVAWAPNTTSTRNCIASAGQDGKVIVWKEKPTGMWEQHPVHDFAVPIYRVRWSITGSVLSVADSRGSITLWKETHPSGKWTQVAE